FAPEGEVREVVEGYGGRVSVAAVNGPENTVVSGAEEAVEACLRELGERGYRWKRLVVSHAFHSPLMDPVLGEFERVAGGVRYGERRIGVVSNVTGRVAGAAELCRPGYWRDHLRQAVRFADGVRALWESGYRVFVEVGPSPTLVGMARRCVEGEGEGLWVASLREGREDWRTLLEGVGALYVRGVGVDWAAFDRPYGRRKVALPTYPFQRERYWLPDQPGAGARRNGAGTIGRGGAGEQAHPLLGVRLRSP